MCGRGGSRKAKGKAQNKGDDGFEAWGGYMAAKKAKLLDQFHSEHIEKVSDLFAGVRILVNGLTHPPAAELKNLMAAHGGEYHLYQASSTTHIIASNLPNVKIKHLGAVPVVKPAWITESIALNKVLDYTNYLLYTNQSRLQPALNFTVLPKVEESHEETVPINKASDGQSNDNVDQRVSVGSRVTKTASDPQFLEEFYSNSRLHLISTLGAEFKQLIGQMRENFDGKFLGREKLILNTGRSNGCPQAPVSVVMHIDMDCFFVSVGLRKHPELKGQPVAIAHARSGVINSTDPKRQAIRDQEFALYEERLPEGGVSRVVDIKEKMDGLASMSEIASCSYEARQYGIKNGMFLGQAVKQCPGLKTLPYDFEGYKEVSNLLYNTVASYTLDIEAVSCDEMYVDVKPILVECGMTVEEWASHIRSEIMAVTGCPCSTGFGANRLQARLATRKAKPAGQYYLQPDEVDAYMAEISLADLPGVGRATLAKLRNLGFNTCGDLQSGSLRNLQTELGTKLGERIWKQVHGLDNKPLDFNHERKSVSAEINYGIRFKTKEECYSFLQSLANEVYSRLSDINMKARGLTLKLLVRAEGAPVETAKFLGHGVCDAITKSSTVNMLFSNSDVIYKEAKAIYDKLNVAFAELRGVGIQLTKLEKNAPKSKALSNFLKRAVVAKPPTEPNITSLAPAIPQINPIDSGGLQSKASASTKTGQQGSKGKSSTRGRKKSTKSSTMQQFLGQAGSPSASTSRRDNGGQLVMEPKSRFHLNREQIDLDVLKELPQDIRNELLREYQLDLKPQQDGGKWRPTETDQLSTGSDQVASSPVKKSPFANQSWEQVKEGIKTWIKTEGEPATVDVEMLADYLRNLALDRRIEILHSGFNFLYRNFHGLSCAWHRAYFSLVDAVQQGMVARYAARSCDSLESPANLKRNKSDSVLSKKSSQEGVQLKKNESGCLGKRIEATDSCNSLPYSKTSSEHSLDELLDRRQNQQKLDRELRYKLEKLQSTFDTSRQRQTDESRLRLKRAYPWQNFNLSSAPKADLDFPKRQARTCNNLLKSSASDQSISSGSNPSLSRKSSVNSFSSLDRPASKDSLEDLKSQMPLFKSILKKSTSKQGSAKEVTFNNISTIYSAKAKAEDGPRGFSRQKKSGGEREVPGCLGRYQPLKEEHSFLYLYTGKKQKTV